MSPKTIPTATTQHKIQQADNKDNQQDAEAQQDFEKALKRGAVKIGGQLGQKLIPDLAMQRD